MLSKNVSFTWKSEQQESIPIGCVPPTLVATTRCQYWGGGRYVIYLSLLACRHPWYTFPRLYLPFGYLPPGYPPQKGPGTRDTYPPEGTWDQRYISLGRDLEQTDISENITFPQRRWRAVKITDAVVRMEFGSLRLITSSPY